MAPKNIKFLLIDDYEPITNMLIKTIRELEFDGEIKTAINGENAIALIDDDQLDFDFIICDFVMPVINGLGVLENVRRNEKYSKIPFLMLTAEKDRETIMSCIKAGASNYIIKPWSTNALKEKIDYCWNKHHESEK